MKIKSVKNIIKHFVCWILLLQVINISIDPPNLVQFKDGRITNKEDRSINQIESIYEMISEEIFNKDVPESDQNDAEKYLETFDLYSFSLIDNTLIVPEFPVKHNRFYVDNFLAHYPEPNSPPPKKA